MKKRESQKSVNMVKTEQLLIPVLLLFLISSSAALAEKSKVKINLRNVRWGMTRLEVMASEEKAPEFFTTSSILYKPEIEGREFHLVYEFVEHRLTDASYFFEAYSTSDYLWLKRLLQIKYGAPFSSNEGGYENFEYKWKDAFTEITLKPGRKREYVIEYKGLKYRYLKAIKENKITMKKEKNARKTF